MISLSDNEWLNIFSRLYFWATFTAVSSGAIALLASKGMQIYSERLSVAQNKQISDAQSQAAEANRQASSANERVAEAQVRTAEATAKAAIAIEGQKKLELESEQARMRQREFEAQAAQSRKEQEQLRKQNLELQSKVEREQIERLKLQERFASRSLSDLQKAKLAVILRSFPPGEVKVTVFVGTEDGIPFSLDIIGAINDSGWKAVHTGQTTMGGNIRGVALLVKDVNKAPRIAFILQNAFKEIGIEAPAVNNPEMTEEAVTIFIAPKSK